MKSSNPLSLKLLKKSVSKWLIVGLLLVSFIGFTDASYITINTLAGHELGCSITHGCGEVTSSEYSKILGIPVSVLGMGYYLVIFLLSVLYLDRTSFAVLRILSSMTVVGFLASLWFIYVQGVILEAWCQYCLLSALSSTILFGIGLVIKNKLYRLNKDALAPTDEKILAVDATPEIEA